MTTAAKSRKGAETGRSKGADSVDAQQLLKALRLMRKGDFSHRLPLDQTGVDRLAARPSIRPEPARIRMFSTNLVALG